MSILDDDKKSITPREAYAALPDMVRDYVSMDSQRMATHAQIERLQTDLSVIQHNLNVLGVEIMALAGLLEEPGSVAVIVDNPACVVTFVRPHGDEWLMNIAHSIARPNPS